MLRHLPESALWRRDDAAEEIIRRYIPLAHRLAGEYAGGREALSDLRQVACLGLVGAVSRFDPERGTPFAAFAAITIRGTLKRSFRDDQLMRVPRSLHDRMMELRGIDRRLGGAPIEVLAEEAGITVDEAREAWVVGAHRFALSLDRPMEEDNPDSPPLAEAVPDPSDPYVSAEARLLLEDLDLDERDLTVIRMRFEEDRTQAEIAEVLGCTQMHVSRLLRSILLRLRRQIGEPVG